MSTKSARATVDEALKTKNRTAAAITGDHRVTKMLKAAGADTVFTWRGAHLTARRV